MKIKVWIFIFWNIVSLWAYVDLLVKNKCGILESFGGVHKHVLFNMLMFIWVWDVILNLLSVWMNFHVILMHDHMQFIALYWEVKFIHTLWTSFFLQIIMELQVPYFVCIHVNNTCNTWVLEHACCVYCSHEQYMWMIYISMNLKVKFFVHNCRLVD